MGNCSNSKFSCKIGDFLPMGLTDGIFLGLINARSEPLVTFLGLKNQTSPYEAFFRHPVDISCHKTRFSI